MAVSTKKQIPGVPSGTYREFRYDELERNPLNPRRLFDRKPLDVLKQSIARNGILVPLTVFQGRNQQFYILDGERRWCCAQEIETDPANPRPVKIPANVVDPPTKVANILCMFNIQNLREQWELMPTALSLKILMEELKEDDAKKLAELTQLSEPNVKRCKILFSYPEKYQRMMLDPNPENRIRANFFIELNPVLDLYEAMPKKQRGGKTRDELTDHFLHLYTNGKIPSVIHFRRILEAHDYLETDPDRYELFQAAMSTLATTRDHTIRKLFDPLVAEDKSVATAEELCRDFLKEMRRLKIAHTATRRAELRRLLSSIRQYLDELLTALEG